MTNKKLKIFGTIALMTIPTAFSNEINYFPKTLESKKETQIEYQTKLKAYQESMSDLEKNIEINTIKVNFLKSRIDSNTVPKEKINSYTNQLNEFNNELTEYKNELAQLKFKKDSVYNLLKRVY